MALLLQQVMNAVPLAALYGALAFGYALVFGVLGRANITYGALFAFSGQIFVLFVHRAWSDLYLVLPAALALGALAAVVYTGAAGLLIGRQVLLPLKDRNPNALLVGSLAVLILLSETARLAADARELWLSPLLNRRLVVFEEQGFAVSLTLIQVINTGLFVAAVAAGGWIMGRSRLGRIWRAVADDPAAARLCGIDADGVFVWSVLAGTAYAGLCGVMATVHYGTMDFATGLIFGLKVPLIAAAGGHGRPLAAALGAAAVALAETLWNGLAPILWKDLAITGGLVLLLVLRHASRLDPATR